MDKEELRNCAIKDSDQISQKQRFGLFSQPLTTAVGDNGPYQTSLRIHFIDDRSEGKLGKRKTYH